MDGGEILGVLSLDAAAASGPGKAADAEGLVNDCSLQMLSTGGGTWSADVEGSMDGAHWAFFQTFSADGLYAVSSTSRLVRYVRVNLTSLSGGSSPTVTAILSGRLKA